MAAGPRGGEGSSGVWGFRGGLRQLLHTAGFFQISLLTGANHSKIFKEKGLIPLLLGVTPGQPKDTHPANSP